MLRLAIIKAAIVKGMVRPSPRIWLISVLWVATRIEPAQKNKVILPKACEAICIPPPINPNRVANMAPRTI